MTDTVSAPADTGPGPLSQLCDKEWQGLLDKDDRNSPAEYPDMLLISRVELGCVMSEAYLLAKDQDGPRIRSLEARAERAEAERDEVLTDRHDELADIRRDLATAEATIVRLDEDRKALCDERAPIIEARFEAEARALTAEARLAEAVEALKPFAEVADMFDDSDDDYHEIWMDVGRIGVPNEFFRLGHYRKARLALSAHNSKEERGG